MKEQRPHIQRHFKSEATSKISSAYISYDLPILTVAIATTRRQEESRRNIETSECSTQSFDACGAAH
jgi:hypothetical protein